MGSKIRTANKVCKHAGVCRDLLLGLLCLDNEDNHHNPCQRHLAQARHSGEKLQTFFIVVTFSWSLASWLVHQWGHRLGSSQRLIGKF